MRLALLVLVTARTMHMPVRLFFLAGIANVLHGNFKF